MSFSNLSLDLRFDEDLMLISSFKAIVSNNVCLTVNLNQDYNILQGNSMRKCDEEDCVLCPHLRETEQKTIKADSNCNSRGIVYLFQCSCGLSYVGCMNQMTWKRFEDHWITDDRSPVNKHKAICNQVEFALHRGH